MKIDESLSAAALLERVDALFELSARKLRSLERDWDASRGTPVFTVQGRYTARGWTEWTQGFRFGSMLLQFDATGERRFLDLGRAGTLAHMAVHTTHTGVHDHGFNTISTYGALHRLIREGRLETEPAEAALFAFAIKVSGAVQAARWTRLRDGSGFIHSFNGPHSLFVDTLRTLRAPALAHQLGHVLMGENDEAISLLDRLVQHARNTARYSVYYGEGRDAYDVRGRTAHECVFNCTDGRFRCPNSQQGYSPFSTWMRGLAWAIAGFAEELEFLAVCADAELDALGGREALLGELERAALATADFYLAHTPADGIPYWDSGAPGLARLGDYLGRPADPYNDHEPVDSSAAAIAAQGLLRLGRHLARSGRSEPGRRYHLAGLTVARALLAEPYLSTDDGHQGLILHSVYHRPNGWDYVPPGRKVPCGESSMWGDYHARELANLVRRLARGETYPTFFDPK